MACLRRSWLLAAVGPALDYRCRREGRLIELLALCDEELLQALGGRRREELEQRYADFRPSQILAAEDVSPLCRHDPRFPRALSGEAAPRMLYVGGGAERFKRLTDAPVVAIAGSAWATDYGMETAKSLARGLAASGVTVASGLTDGIAVAAQAGALEVDAGTVAVAGAGLDVASPAKRRSLYAQVRRLGCAVAELPSGAPARRWGQPASERILAGLATLTVVVEARDSPRELALARLAVGLKRVVAAVPGRVTSSASGGTHTLLLGGAHLVRGPSDVLELLYRMGARGAVAAGAESEPGYLHTGLDERLKRTLEAVGAGRDTPEKLNRGCRDPQQVLLALSELELLGLLARGDGGRYVPRDAACPG